MFQLFYQSWKEGGQSLSRKVGMIWTVDDIWISKQETSQAIKLAGMNSFIINNYAKSTQSLMWLISNHVFYFVFFLFCYVWRRVELIPRYNNPSSLVKSTDVYEVASEEQLRKMTSEQANDDEFSESVELCTYIKVRFKLCCCSLNRVKHVRLAR